MNRYDIPHLGRFSVFHIGSENDGDAAPGYYGFHEAAMVTARCETEEDAERALRRAISTKATEEHAKTLEQMSPLQVKCNSLHDIAISFLLERKLQDYVVPAEEPSD